MIVQKISHLKGLGSFKRPWVDSLDDKASFDQYIEAILEGENATKDKERKKQANNNQVKDEEPNIELP